MTAVALVALVVGIAFAVFSLSVRYFQSEEFSKASGRLSLYQSTVVAELERFSHLTFVLARDPFVVSAASGNNTDALNDRLAQFAERAGIDAIFLMNLSGLTIAASNAGQSPTFLGQNYGFRPYFQSALNGEQGRFYGIGATTGLPGYFIADAVQSFEGEIGGVIAIKIDLSKLAASWASSGEQVFLANKDGVVLLSSDARWQYRILQDISDTQRAEIAASRQFPGQELDVLEWRMQGLNRAIIAGEERLHLTSTELPHEWALHYFASDERAVTRSWLVTAGVVLFAVLLIIVLQIQRTRRMGIALRRSKFEEAELRRANERLGQEIEVRRQAERRLKRTQGELERASRLAALGQLSASVTHELGQPIAAMRNHLTAAELAPEQSQGLTTRLSGLVDRMEGITRELKFFARSEGDVFTAVDLNQAVRAARGLIAPNLDVSDVALSLQLPAAPVFVQGVQLRIEQVLTNLMRNALDAVKAAPGPQVSVTVEVDGTHGWVRVVDNGHGLGEATLADLQEPFVTTRESGQGMGLGLAISAGIVKDHGGHMTADNNSEGGATFAVAFPLSEAQTEADHAG